MLELTPNFNTTILSGAFSPEEKFHGETFLLIVKSYSAL